MMVRELHKHQLEVILDVVFNHTREGNHYGADRQLQEDWTIIFIIAGAQPEYYMDLHGLRQHPQLNIGRPAFSSGMLPNGVNEMARGGFSFDRRRCSRSTWTSQQKGKTP